jgi:segregation and condensation protein B
MSSIAKMIETIESELDAKTEEVAANPEHLRMVEALLFAASEPLDQKALSTSLPEGADVPALLAALEGIYQKRGVNLCCVAGKYQFRTASDLAFLLRKEQPEQKRLSKAAIETLAIIAYHQPVTRAEIEDIRGVAMSKGTIDMLMEIGWIKIRGRKRTPGRPSPTAPPRPSWFSSGWRAWRTCRAGRAQGRRLPGGHAAVRLRCAVAVRRTGSG